MKKIINGKRYDTVTAQELNFWHNMDDYRNFNYCKETLYRKRTGEFFLHGEGNAASKYAESVGQNCWGSGEEIIPLTEENARRWAEEHLSGEEYEEIFGEVSEDGEDTNYTIKLSPALVKKLEQAALAQGISKADIIRKLIEDM